ncbi:hypothetical protein TTHERM_00529500 (macronuclear) [Tetrahymena thermophila SB210]|uniref:Uncharacterized protein n=1 Tax=Tetrahymena thermophila (strain SB210) TaxID=312017 RepID=I7LZV7_TETTS|nr:hypothetical protein TTHERM_00529500 [Tetrahymena thermophila SB210]EAR84998.1 hypothetical protein TTHERM_00529500 [Tetrahymena thermophila SB210]|eukprot:XP_001032661.1 hypothetical protein TTHERM_00529500 [Tetrahymena thermophila SB210]
MGIYNQNLKSVISQLKIICFQIKEDLNKQKIDIQKYREQIYNHFNISCKDLEFSNMKEDADFLLHQRRKLSGKQNLNPQDNHFFEISIQKLLKFKLQFSDKNQIINMFIQQSKQQVNNNYSLNKKLIDNMDSVRKELYQYFNSVIEE